MDDEVAERLLAAINQEPSRLAILFGAGLSVADPSNVPLAEELLEVCVEGYEEHTGATVDFDDKTNLGSFASYLYARNHLRSLFMGELVPWERFRDSFNQGHEAIADFLICGALEFSVTTNFDTLVEDATIALGDTHFVAAIDGREAGRQTQRYHKPLLKIHGCCNKRQRDTVWCADQLDEDEISARIDHSRNWLQANLPERNVIVIVGFWTDWNYINALFTHCLSRLTPQEEILFVVVNPSSEAELREDAPDLFDICDSTDEIEFLHINESGDSFLSDLRRRFSCQLLRRCEVDEVEAVVPNDLTNEELYSIRKQVFGYSPDEVVKDKEPVAGSDLVVEFERWLVEQGGTREGSVFDMDGTTVRVVNGSGKSISQMADDYRSKSPKDADVTVCVGATEVHPLRHFVDRGAPSTVARDLDRSEWISGEEAMVRFKRE